MTVLELKNKILKIIFGKKYKKQPWTFWRLFWKNKLDELKSLGKNILKYFGYTLIGIIILFIVSYLLFYIPIYKFEHKTFPNILPNYNYQTNYNYIYSKTNITIKGHIFYNKEYQKQYLSKFESRFPNECDRDSYYIFSDVKFKELNKLEYNNLYDIGNVEPIIRACNKKYNLAEWGNIEVKCLDKNNYKKIFHSITTNKIKNKEIDGATGFIVSLALIAIYIVIIIIILELRDWLRDNYIKLLKESKK